MATREKLEIIKDSGEIFFYEIEPHQEFIKFGSHLDNDIVFSSPQISPFHAVIDMRRRPYQFVELNETTETTDGDQILSPSTAREARRRFRKPTSCRSAGTRPVFSSPFKAE